MDMDEINAIGGKDLLFEDTEDETFLFSKNHNVIKSRRQIGKVEDVINFVAPNSSKKTMVLRMPEAIFFLEYIVVRNSTFDTLAEVVDARGRACQASRGW
jgi:hypothetical protein